MASGKGLKVELRNANSAKTFLIARRLLDFEKKLKKEKSSIIFPIISDIYDDFSGLEFDFELVDFEFDENKKRPKFDDLLNNILTSEELEKVKKAYDVVGDIAIIEIDDILKHKAEEIAQALLKSDPNVKTVLRKAGSHGGTFRTQDMEYLAGVETKESTHRENGIALKMDVEKVYFSARLSTERKRISNLVKPEEEILAMFSGAAPYPCVLSKNTPAKYIWGIEINPDGFRYGLENVSMNKLPNVFLMNDDVRKAVPNLYKKMIGLKSAIKPHEMKKKLDLKPDLFEIHTFLSDFEDEGFEKLKSAIKDIKSNGIQVVVHQPISWEPKVDAVACNAKHPITSKMLSLVDEFDVDLIIHVSIDRDRNDIDFESLVSNIKSYEKYGNKIHFENSAIDYFSTLEEFIELIKATGMKSMCVDTCHMLYIYTPEELVNIIGELQKHVNTYFHISDLKEISGIRPEKDPLHGGKLDQNSRLPIKDILPLVTKGIVEVNDSDYVESPNQISSWEYLSNFQKKFDRILMPLPKSAEEFLPDALKCAKSGTIIHMYDFLHEDQFHVAHEKIESACKDAGLNYELIETVKCGQHAPHVYRICVDFKIL